MVTAVAVAVSVHEQAAGLHEQAADWSLRAARKARGLNAYAEAWGHYERALHFGHPAGHGSGRGAGNGPGAVALRSLSRLLRGRPGTTRRRVRTPARNICRTTYSGAGNYVRRRRGVRRASAGALRAGDEEAQ
jgi:hypothetical protein